MNSIEKLQVLTQECEPCIWNAQIIEFEELPEHEKYNFDFYDKDKDFTLYCKKCNYYQILQNQNNGQGPIGYSVTLVMA